jgi:hypothetical protein
MFVQKLCPQVVKTKEEKGAKTESSDINVFLVFPALFQLASYCSNITPSSSSSPLPLCVNPTLFSLPSWALSRPASSRNPLESIQRLLSERVDACSGAGA